MIIETLSIQYGEYNIRSNAVTDEHTDKWWAGGSCPECNRYWQAVDSQHYFANKKVIEIIKGCIAAHEHVKDFWLNRA